MTGRVVVVGSANADLTIPIERVPVRGETVLGGSLGRGPGGKGLNQVVAAARMGVSTAFVGAVGDDADGAHLVGVLAAEGVDTELVQVVSVPTGVALILLESDGANRIVVAPGANRRVTVPVLDLQPGDVVVAQLEVPVDVVADALGSARAVGATTVLNAAPASDVVDDLLGLVDVLVVNEPELATMARSAVGEDVRIALGRLPEDLSVVVTLGPEGALVAERGQVIDHACPEVDVVDTTGAGDCFVGVLCAALVEGHDLDGAVTAAVAAATQSVTVSGAAPSMPTRHAVPTFDLPFRGDP